MKEWIYGGPKEEIPSEQWRGLMAKVGIATYQSNGAHLIRIDDPIEINGIKYEPGVYSCG